MNNTVYHPAEVSVGPGLPTPGINDIAEVFGTSSGQIDQARGIETIDAAQGVYNIGVTGAGAAQIQKGPNAGKARVYDDFYVR